MEIWIQGVFSALFCFSHPVKYLAKLNPNKSMYPIGFKYIVSINAADIILALCHSLNSLIFHLYFQNLYSEVDVHGIKCWIFVFLKYIRRLLFCI